MHVKRVWVEMRRLWTLEVRGIGTSMGGSGFAAGGSDDSRDMAC